MAREDELFTIGDLALRAGVPTRTVRFWSDEGLISVCKRSGAGHRLYDASAVAKLDLVRTLRELGFGLEDIANVLRRRTTLAEIAAAHLEALEARIRALRLQRSVLRVVARGAVTAKEMKIMHAIAKLSAAERQALLDRFVERAFEGVPNGAPGSQIAAAMRALPRDLPDDPSEAQLDAWLELAELVDDPTFQARVREMALRGASASATTAPPLEHARVITHAQEALEQGIDPRSSSARTIVDRIVPPALNEAQRRALAANLETFTDERVERYWQLIGVLSDRPSFPSQVRPYRWLIEALKSPAQ